MPFENKAVVAKINGKKVLELINFLNQENIAHPVSGIKLKFDKNSFSGITLVSHSLSDEITPFAKARVLSKVLLPIT